MKQTNNVLCLSCILLIFSILYINLDELIYKLTIIPPINDDILSAIYNNNGTQEIIHRFTSLNNEINITDDEMDFFYANGYLIYRNVIPPEIIDIFSLYAFKTFDNPPYLFKILSYFGMTVDFIPWIDSSIYDDKFDNIVTNLPWQLAISKLLNYSSLGLGDMHFLITNPPNKTNTIYKGFGGQTKLADGWGNLHSDSILSPFYTSLHEYTVNNNTYKYFGGNSLNIWIPLDNTEAYTLEVYPKSHLFNNDSVGNNLCKIIGEINDNNDFAKYLIDIKLNKGDIVLLDFGVIHRGKQNISISNINTTRRMAIKYTDPNTRCRGFNYIPYYSRLCPNKMGYLNIIGEAGTKCDKTVLLNGRRKKRISPRIQKCLPRFKDWLHYLYNKWTNDFVPCMEF